MTPEREKSTRSDLTRGLFVEPGLLRGMVETMVQGALEAEVTEYLRAEQYERYSERLAAKGYVTELQLVGDRFAVEEARKELQSAQTKLHILDNYTKKKQIMHLEADVKTAEANFNVDRQACSG